MKTIDYRLATLNDLYNLIKIGKYDYVFEELTKLKNSKEYQNYQTEIAFLLNYVNEKIYDKKIIGTKENEIKDEYLNSGKMSIYFDDIYTAYNIFSAGYYVTENPIFLFLAGKTLYFTQDQKEEGIKLIEKYIEEGGGSYLIKSYEYLSTYYNYIDTNKSKKYRKRSERLLELVDESKESEIGNNIAFDDKKSVLNEYIKSGKINFVLQMYNLANFTKQIEIISELYKNGYSSLASKLAKQYKKDNISKYSKQLLKQLEKNKTLYINKGKNR